MDRLPILSIVSPAYNEEEVLPPFHAELMKVLEPLQDEFQLEILYIDDGSSDRTPLVLQQLSAIDPRVQFLSFSRNFGHQAALTAGLEHASGDVIVSMDSDLQHPPQVILELLAQWRQGKDIVLTIRQDHESLGIMKRLTSRLFYTVMRYCSGMEIRPAAADFRLLSRRALDAFLKMPERHRFIRGMVHWLGFSPAEVTFEAPPRFAGKSKFTIVRMIRLARDGLLSFSRIPLHLSLLAAGGMIALSFIVSMITWLLARPEGALGWMLFAFIVSVHLAGSAFWIALVAFSEYLARIHEQVMGRPLYVVQQSSYMIQQAKSLNITHQRERPAA